MSIEQAVQILSDAFGLPGAVVIGWLGFLWWQERKDRKATEKEIRDNSREMFEAVSALREVFEFVKRGGK